MSSELRPVAELPSQSASQVKNKWKDVVRAVQQSGSVAITNHSQVEMVLLDVATYEYLAGLAQAQKIREQHALDELAARFDQRLEVLQAPGAAQKVSALLKSKGRLRKPPKAGASF